MSEQIITVSKSLWLVLDTIELERGDGFLTIRDDVGGEALIVKDEVPVLIEALQKVLDEYGPKEQVNG